MKPDIVFFGEGLSDEFHTRIGADKDECDLLIVIGSSLKVRPVALIPSKFLNSPLCRNCDVIPYFFKLCVYVYLTFGFCITVFYLP